MSVRAEDLEQAAADLEAAADLLESETIGWCQDTYLEQHIQSLSACAIGAIGVAVLGKPRLVKEGAGAYFIAALCASVRVKSAQALAEAQLLQQFPQSWWVAQVEPLAEWNDSWKRTREEVVDLFKSTAKEIRDGSLELPEVLP